MHPYINIHIHIRRTYKVDECIYIRPTQNKMRIDNKIFHKNPNFKILAKVVIQLCRTI